jgi:hypothetical protein
VLFNSEVAADGGLPSRQRVSCPLALTLCAERSNATVASSSPSWLPLQTPTSAEGVILARAVRAQGHAKDSIGQRHQQLRKL